MSAPLARSLSLEARYALLELQKENNRLLCRALAAERKLEMAEIALLCKREFKGDFDE